MKRHNYLWQAVSSFENLLLAARTADRGKRFRDNVLEFNYHLEPELTKLQQELTQKTYRPGAYRTFRIFEPKPRLISAAPYRDRVVHHAVCNIIVPIFQQDFIPTSYANRIGFGTHRGLHQFTHHARTQPYVLQCDIKKYFASIDHQILKSLLRRKLKCQDTLWLLDTIIDASNAQEAVYDYFPGDDLLSPLSRSRGLPLGNLTSQFFANVYLNWFDHYVQKELRIGKYLRYVDDFALFSHDRQVLVDAKPQMEEYLATLRLKLHPHKTQLQATSEGMNFLGFRVLPNQIRVRNDNIRKGRRRLKEMKDAYLGGEITRPEMTQSLQSWFAHLAHGDTWQLRQQILMDLDWLNPSDPFSE
jgi:retron-type reverse transcriptase